MQTTPELPIRWTVCDTAAEVRAIINALEAAGFTHDEISVVCSRETCEQQFREYVHEHPAGSQVNEALNRSGLAALGLGAAAIITGAITLGGTAVVIAGAFSGMAIAGTFSSLMSTRGAERELADYYDQAVTHGKILVAVTVKDPARQRVADRLLGLTGEPTSALPSESPEG